MVLYENDYYMHHHASIPTTLTSIWHFVCSYAFNSAAWLLYYLLSQKQNLTITEQVCCFTCKSFQSLWSQQMVHSNGLWLFRIASNVNVRCYSKGFLV